MEKSLFLSKTKEVLKFPELANLKQAQSFLLTGYFRKVFMIIRSLSDLLKKESKFKFKDEQCKAFNKLKKILSQNPVSLFRIQGMKLNYI